VTNRFPALAFRGVETDGVKDVAKVRAFVAAVREADR